MVDLSGKRDSTERMLERVKLEKSFQQVVSFTRTVCFLIS